MTSGKSARWLKRLGIACLAFLLFYTFFGFWGVPLLIRHVGLAQLNEQVAGTFEIEAIRFNPYGWRLELDEVTGRTPDDELALQIRAFTLDIDPLSAFGEEFVVEEFSVEEPFLNVIVDEAGNLNIQSSLARLQERAEQIKAEAVAVPADEPFVIPAVRVDRLAVLDAGLRCEIRSLGRPVSREIQDVSFVMDGVSTAPSHENPYRFGLSTVRGESFELEGELRLDPLSTEGRVTLENLELRDLLVFAGDQLGLEIQDGHLDVAFAYVFRPLGESPKLALEAGSVTLRSLALAPQGEPEPFQTLERLAVTGWGVDLLGKRVSAEAFEWENGELHVTRDAEGVLNLIRYVTPPERQAAVAAEAAAEREQATREREIKLGVVSEGQDLGVALTSAWHQLQELVELRWKLDVARVSVRGQRLLWRDAFLARPAELRWDDISLSATGLNNDATEPFPFELAMRWGADGALRAEGQFTPEPPQATFTLTAERLPLVPLGPYLDGLAPLRLADGELNLNLRAETAFPDDQTPEVGVTGTASLAALRLDWAEPTAPFLAWRDLSVQGIDAASDPLSFNVAQVQLSEPQAWLERTADGGLRLPLPETPPSEPAGASQPETVSANPVDWRVDELLVTGGTVKLADASVQPATSFSLTDLQWRAAPLTAEPGAGLTTDLSFRLADGPSGAVTLHGALQPFQPLESTEFTLGLKGVTMSFFAPYAVPVIGQPPLKGRLSADLGYALNQGQIKGSNDIRVKNLRFGPRVPDSEAPDLPLELGVAILEDTEGLMQLDIPVEGDTNSPGFSLDAVIERALTNVLEKVVTAPFSMLGSVFPGEDGAPANEVAFVPGQTILPESALASLDKLAEVLAERPGLQLELTPSVDLESDSRALAEQAVQARVAALVAEGDDVADAVEDLYDELPETQQASPEADLTTELMRDHLVDAAVVGPDDLARLAGGRAEAVRVALREDGLGPERVAQTELPDGDAYATDGSKVVFGLAALADGP